MACDCSNIQPIRVILRRRAGHEKEDGGGAIASLFPYLPWKTQRSRKVAVVEYVLRPRPQNTTCTDAGDVLDMILHVPPLLQAFEDYCRKALCSEVKKIRRSSLGCVSYTQLSIHALLQLQQCCSTVGAFPSRHRGAIEPNAGNACEVHMIHKVCTCARNTPEQEGEWFA